MLESCVRDVKALLCVSLAVVIAYAFGALDGFVRRCLVRCVADGLGTRARLASASLSLSSGTLELRGAAVANWLGFADRGDACAVDRVRLDLCPLALATRRCALVRQASFRGVAVSVSRHADGTFNAELADGGVRTEFARKHSLGCPREPVDEDWVEVAPPPPTATLPPTAVAPPTAPAAPARSADAWALVSGEDVFDAECKASGGGWRAWRGRGSGESGARAQTLAAERDELQEREKVAQTLPAVGASAEETRQDFEARTTRWAREHLQTVVAALLARDATSSKSTWTLRFEPGATLLVDGLSLQLLGADGGALLEPALVFARRELCDVHARLTGTRCAVDVAHGLVALLAEDCVCELLEHRPQDAARLSVALARELAHDTRASTAGARRWLALLTPV